MKVLVACEESQAVCKAFRARGHEAYSCDIIEPSGGHPEWHILGDALKILNPKYIEDVVEEDRCMGIEFCTMDGQYHFIDKWDLLIAHPPCTYLTNAGAVRMRKNGKIVPERYALAMEAKAFFMKLYNSDVPKIAVENPTPMKIVDLPPYTQAIQPYEHGHAYSKRTCLWLKNLPKLQPTKICDYHVPYVNGGCKDAKGNYGRFQGRRERDPRIRAKTFTGIAEAMADQWGGLA